MGRARSLTLGSRGVHAAPVEQGARAAAPTRGGGVERGERALTRCAISNKENGGGGEEEAAPHFSSHTRHPRQCLSSHPPHPGVRGACPARGGRGGGARRGWCCGAVACRSYRSSSSLVRGGRVRCMRRRRMLKPAWPRLVQHAGWVGRLAMQHLAGRPRRAPSRAPACLSKSTRSAPAAARRPRRPPRPLPLLPLPSPPGRAGRSPAWACPPGWSP